VQAFSPPVRVAYIACPTAIVSKSRAPKTSMGDRYYVYGPVPVMRWVVGGVEYETSNLFNDFNATDGDEDGANVGQGSASAGTCSAARSATRSIVQFRSPQPHWHLHWRHRHVCATATAGSDMPIVTSSELSRYPGVR